MPQPVTFQIQDNRFVDTAVDTLRLVKQVAVHILRLAWVDYARMIVVVRDLSGKDAMRRIAVDIVQHAQDILIVERTHGYAKLVAWQDVDVLARVDVNGVYAGVDVLIGGKAVDVTLKILIADLRVKKLLHSAVKEHLRGQRAHTLLR